MRGLSGGVTPTASLLAIGALSVVAQVVLLRELNAAFYGVELLYLIGLAVWLVWTGLGTALAARRRRAPAVATLGWGFAAVAPMVLGAVVFLRGSGWLLHGVRGAYLPLWQQLGALAAALGPACVVFGSLFQWAARRAVASGRTLAHAYAVESTGALGGGLAAAVLVRAGVQNLTLAAGVAAAALLMALAGPAAQGRRSARVASAGVVILAAAGVALAPAVDHHLSRWQQPELVEARDSPYARVAVTRRGDQVALFENNALAFDTESADAESFAHLVLLQHPAPARVLLVGGGPAGLIGATLSHGVTAIDDVELDPVLVGLVARHAPQALRPSDRAVHLVVDEPRRFLRRAGRYEAMLVGMPEPDSGAANRFYTREFFALAARHLTVDGVLGLRLRGAENVWTPAELRRLSAVHRALGAVFADVVVLPGPTVVIVASQAPLPRDPETLAARLAARRIAARVVTPAYLRYVYTTVRRADLAAALAGSTVEPNTDTSPACYQDAAIIWLGKFWPRVSRLDARGLRARTPGGRALRWALALGWLAVVFACRRKAGRRRRLLAFAAGFAGMVLETVWLIHYQMKQGALFEDLAALVSAFMAGLAAGAFAARRLGLGDRRRRTGAPRAVAAGLLAALVGLAAGSAAVIQAGRATSVLTVAAWLGGTGALVAALFACASVDEVTDQQRVISPLYAADLVGGALGALLATLILIPAAGLPATAVWIVGLATLTLLVV